MATSAHQQSQSPLLLWESNPQRAKKSSKERAKPAFQEAVRDYKYLLNDLTRTFTEVVDKAFPNADFLHRNNVPGSNIEKGTTLSFVLRACFGISQMKMPKELVENYRATLKKFLNDIQHNSLDKTLYAELLNTVHVYQSLANASKNQMLVSNELTRLTGLDLPPKTIDRRLKQEWSQTCVQQPIAEVTKQVAKAMRSSERLQSLSLAGRSNSLGGLARLVNTMQTRGQKQHTYSEAFPKQEENDELTYQSATPSA